MTLKGKIKVLDFFNGLYLLNGACCDKRLYDPNSLLINLLHALAQIMTIYDFLWAKQVILRNV